MRTVTKSAVTRAARTRAAALATTALALSLTACGTDSDPAASGGPGNADAPLTVAASPTPHADILGFVRDNLAEKAGLKLEVREFTDYVLPNTATENGEVDANYFQHKPYLDDVNAKQGTHLVPVTGVHLEPLGLYSSTLKKASELGAGDTVAVPNDTTNEGRALKLLDDHGLIELKDGAGQDATLADIADAKGLEFKELEAAALPRSLEDVDAAVVNGNYAIEAGLEPAEDALALEAAEGNPYVNLLVVKEGNEDDPRVRKLADLLVSQEVADFIEKEYRGSVVAASDAS
ncbi:MetQ/NlpA family ABC transporter substrate-binding protein [Streptomyces verrucosisporus]|uniref:MetQ/NlpA family ABC transporter substrate-binding protein n=1 Tax=Streptomyces verrucosisporus TaxID=1695161 RepID=UPI0019D1913D|nr:MetQ/NlpA family ABC transporter substrate-binding protein [Streptomyces verrucosisporus]MBN3930056.1 MetQ/NlpA family ABC transporter substrate-binding protein [Streptomyces verrucosisporus]